MVRILFSVVLAAALAACKSVPVDPEAARAAMLRDVGLDPSAVVHQDHARYAIGSGGAQPTAFRSGLYVQTQTDLYLFRHKEGGKALEQDVSFPLAKLQYATLESWMFTDLKQLELGSPSGLLAVSFHDQPDGMAGDPAKADSAYAALHERGRARRKTHRPRVANGSRETLQRGLSRLGSTQACRRSFETGGRALRLP